MLTRDEREQVINELSNHIGVGGSIGALITAVFQASDRTELGNLPIDLNNVQDQSTWVVDACLSNRWKRSPSLLELLLRRLVERGSGGLQSILTRVQVRVDPNPDPFQTLWVLADQPFLDRVRLRKAAKSLVEDGVRPILRVNGPTECGKSYTVQLLNYVMKEARPDLHVVPVTLAKGTGPSFSVEELAEGLVVSMEKSESLPPRSNSSYPAALCRWLIRNVSRNSGLWVFVLDGFGQVDSAGKLDIRDEVLEFIQQLAQYVGMSEFSRKMRLVLLHFDQPLTGNWRAITVDDGLIAGAVTQQDLEACLVEFNVRMQGLGEISRMIRPADIPSLASEMLHRSGGAGASKLPTLYEDLLALAL